MEQEMDNRAVIEGIKPEINGGRFPIKRIVGDEVIVEADIYADGHDVLAAILLWRKEDEARWTEVPAPGLCTLLPGIF